MPQCCKRCGRRHSGHRRRCCSADSEDDGVSGRVPLRGAIGGAVVAVVRGAGFAPGRGTLTAERIAGVGVGAFPSIWEKVI